MDFIVFYQNCLNHFRLSFQDFQNGINPKLPLEIKSIQSLQEFKNYILTEINNKTIIVNDLMTKSAFVKTKKVLFAQKKPRILIYISLYSINSKKNAPKILFWSINIVLRYDKQVRKQIIKYTTFYLRFVAEFSNYLIKCSFTPSLVITTGFIYPFSSKCISSIQVSLEFASVSVSGLLW